MNKKELNYINDVNVYLENKTVVITGGNSGIGFECAKIYAYKKANVYITVRNKEKGEQAISMIKEEIPDAKISYLMLDISDNNSIKNFVSKIIDMKLDIDVFYHNAGVYRLKYQLIDDLDIITKTNFYGPLVLNSLLLPYLHSLNHEVKMIITSSIAATFTNEAKLDLLPNPKRSRVLRYSNSKLLDSYLFYYLLNNDHSNIKYLMVHPGVCRTPLIGKAYKNKIFLFFSNLFLSITANPVWKSAIASLKILEESLANGSFMGPTNFFRFNGYPKKCNFIKKRIKNLNKVINKAEEIIDYKML